MKFLLQIAYTTIVPLTVEADSEAEVRALIDQGGPVEALGVEDEGDPSPLPPRLHSLEPRED